MGDILVFCDIHHEEEAIGICVKCHKPLCEKCLTKVDGRNFCAKCVNDFNQNDETKFKEFEKFPEDVLASINSAEDYLKKRVFIPNLRK